jgi:riboflavin-specific deaminase-like protein
MRASDEKHLKYSSTGMPFVTVKFAQTLDGRIATGSGDSQWISGPSSLKLAHQLRREHAAIMVGIGTVLRDDPRLTVRLVDGRDPLRVVLDSKLRLPPDARVLANGAARLTLIITTEAADLAHAAKLESLGAEILRIEPAAGGAGVDITKALEHLGRRGIESVLVEGGAATVTSLLAERLVDRLVIAIAPKIIGRGTEAVGDLGIERLKDALTFSSFKTRRLGPDIIVDARLNWQRENAG